VPSILSPLKTSFLISSLKPSIFSNVLGVFNQPFSFGLEGRLKSDPWFLTLYLASPSTFIFFYTCFTIVMLIV